METAREYLEGLYHKGHRGFNDLDSDEKMGFKINVESAIKRCFGCDKKGDQNYLANIRNHNFGSETDCRCFIDCMVAN